MLNRLVLNDDLVLQRAADYARAVGAGFGAWVKLKRPALSFADTGGISAARKTTQHDGTPYAPKIGMLD